MIRYERWLVALDRTETDNVLVEHVKQLAEVLKPEKIYFLHVLKPNYVPREALAEYADAFTPEDEKIESKMEESYAGLFTKDVNLSFEAIEGSPLKEILRYSFLKNIDLVIAARKRPEDGRGVLPKLLTRKVPGSTLLVPVDAKKGYKKILVPTDFSDYALESAEEAIEFSRRTEGDEELIFQHIYYVPTGYYKTGKSFEEFAAIMKGHAEKDAAKFFERLDTEDVKYRVDYTLEQKPLQKHILEKAEEEGANLIIVGARGRTDAAAALLGSVTEKLSEENLQFPQLIVRKKGERFDFKDAIMNL